ncbi:MAG: heme-copper oxidase subunit III [Cytophagales bacterium]
MSSKNSAYPGDPQWIEDLRRLHPFKLFIYISIIGIVILFGFLGFGFAVTNNLQHNYLPKYFTFSTLCILFSSFTMSKSLQTYKVDNPKLLNRYLAATFLLGLLFIAFQMQGWKELMDKGIFFSGNVTGSYIYLLSGLHLVHFFGGFIFFLFVYFRAFAAYRDPVKNLLYVTDPYEYMLLDLLGIYWHLMDLLWVALYLLFLFFSI